MFYKSICSHKLIYHLPNYHLYSYANRSVMIMRQLHFSKRLLPLDTLGMQLQFSYWAAWINYVITTHLLKFKSHSLECNFETFLFGSILSCLSIAQNTLGLLKDEVSNSPQKRFLQIYKLAPYPRWISHWFLTSAISRNYSDPLTSLSPELY